jgi:hypothetical protein
LRISTQRFQGHTAKCRNQLAAAGVIARVARNSESTGPPFEAFPVDASIITADARRRRGVAKIEDFDPTSHRAVTEYLSVLDDAAFGATSSHPGHHPTMRGGLLACDLCPAQSFSEFDAQAHCWINVLGLQKAAS